MNKNETTEESFGGSLGKAINLISAFIDGQNSWGVRELASALDQPSSSVHRMLKILRKHRIVDWDQKAQKYHTGNELHRWAAVLRSRMRLPELIRPIAQDLSDAIGESCWFAAYDSADDHIWYALAVQSRRPLRFSSPVGKREDLLASPAGLAVLSMLTGDALSGAIATSGRVADAAFLRRLDETAANGYAVSTEIREDAPVLIASPIVDGPGKPIGSLVMPIPDHRFDPADIPRQALQLKAAADRVSRMLGARLLMGSEESSSYRGIAAIPSIVADRVSDLQLTAWEWGGSHKLLDLQMGRAAYGTATSSDLAAAYGGRPPFDQANTALRAVLGLEAPQLHIVVGDNLDVDDLESLAGLRISPGEEDYATARLFAKLLAFVGVTPRKLEKAGGRLSYLSYAEANRMFESGRLDVLVSLNTAPNESYQRMALKRPYRLLGLDEKLVHRFLDANPAFERAVISAGNYPGVDEPVLTIGEPFYLVTTRHRDQGEVYEVTRALHEKRAELATESPAFNMLQPLSRLKGALVPIHEGALRYYLDG